MGLPHAGARHARSKALRYLSMHMCRWQGYGQRGHGVSVHEPACSLYGLAAWRSAAYSIPTYMRHGMTCWGVELQLVPVCVSLLVTGFACMPGGC